MWKIRKLFFEHPELKFAFEILLVILSFIGILKFVLVIQANLPKELYSIILVDAQGKTIFEQAGTDKITVLSTSDNHVQLSTRGKTYNFENATIKEASNNVSRRCTSSENQQNLLWLLAVPAIMMVLLIIVTVTRRE